MNSENLPNNFIEQLAQQLSQIYFTYDPTKNAFRYLSPNLEALWHVTLENASNNPAALLTHIPEEDQEFLSHQYQKLLLTREKIRVEFRITPPGQEVKWLCVAACMVNDETQQNLIGGYVEDITHLKAYISNLMKYNNKKNSTLEILSHDLAAPFANIQGSINALEEQVTTGDLDVKQLIDFIRQDALRGSDMIRDFIDHEFLESSQVVLHLERVDLVSKFAIMMDNYQERETLISKTFELITAGPPIYVSLDLMKFMQVMNNLVSNAIKFTHDNGRITVSVKEEENHVLITVADNGIGIPEKMQPYLFDRFTPARRAGVRGEKTTGLGMSIIKTIVDLHQGQISFESQESVGTTFYLKIPKE